jgi:hypothetical protein
MVRVNETLDGPTRQLDGNFADLCSALEWSDVHDPDAGLQLVASIRSVWFRRDHGEGRRWTERFLDRCPAQKRARAHAPVAAGDLTALSDQSTARGVLNQAAELAAHLDDPETLVMANILLALIALLEECPEDAVQYLELSLIVAETLDDRGALGGSCLSGRWCC